MDSYPPNNTRFWIPERILPRGLVMRRAETKEKAAFRRAGFSLRGLLIALAMVLIIPAIAFSVLPSWPWSSEEIGPMLHVVERGEFIHEITERGDVESASNVEIRCEVQAQGSGGTTILEIVPEGTYVQPGDQLVRLDSSGLEDEKTKQMITCANSEAVMIQAENDLESAQIALKEYVDGQYVQEKQSMESDIFVAEENLRRGIDFAEYSEKLAAKGFVTKVQYEADKFAVEKYKKDKDAAETRLRVLENYTKEKMTKQLEADIKTFKAKFEAAEHSHKLDKEKLELINTQIAKCVINAPEAGQVVYANQRDSRGGNEVIIEEGTTVRERQVIFRLPDPKRMQVKAKINEAKIALVSEGMRASIRMDAYQNMELKGKVEKVNEYPAPTSWFSSNVKEYETIIHIEEPPPGLRPGLTAQVKIRVNVLPDVVQVPVQTIFEHGDGKHYAVVRDGSGWRPQQVEIGATNDKFVVIREGLEAGQNIVLNALAYREKIAMPEVPPEIAAKAGAGGKPTGGQPAETAGSPPGDGTGAGNRSPGEPAAERPAGGGGGMDPAAIVDRIFQSDKNSDGKIQKDEAPEPMWSRFSSADKNGDGAIDRAELTAAMKAMGGQAGGGRRGGPRGGGERPGGGRP